MSEEGQSEMQQDWKVTMKQEQIVPEMILCHYPIRRLLGTVVALSLTIGLFAGVAHRHHNNNDKNSFQSLTLSSQSFSTLSETSDLPYCFYTQGVEDCENVGTWAEFVFKMSAKYCVHTYDVFGNLLEVMNGPGEVHSYIGYSVWQGKFFYQTHNNNSGEYLCHAGDGVEPVIVLTIDKDCYLTEVDAIGITSQSIELDYGGETGGSGDGSGNGNGGDSGNGNGNGGQDGDGDGDGGQEGDGDGPVLSPFKVSFKYVNTGEYCDTAYGEIVYGCGGGMLCDMSDHRCKCYHQFCSYDTGFPRPDWNETLGVCTRTGYKNDICSVDSSTVVLNLCQYPLVCSPELSNSSSTISTCQCSLDGGNGCQTLGTPCRRGSNNCDAGMSCRFYCQEDCDDDSGFCVCDYGKYLEPETQKCIAWRSGQPCLNFSGTGSDCGETGLTCVSGICERICDPNDPSNACLFELPDGDKVCGFCGGVYCTKDSDCGNSSALSCMDGVCSCPKEVPCVQGGGEYCGDGGGLKNQKGQIICQGSSAFQTDLIGRCSNPLFCVDGSGDCSICEGPKDQCLLWSGNNGLYSCIDKTTSECPDSAFSVACIYN